MSSAIINTGLNDKKINSTDYMTVRRFDYQSDSNVVLSQALFASSLCPKTPDDSNISGFGYQVRIINVTNNKVLCETTLTKSSEQTFMLNINSNNIIPDTIQNLELQCKRQNNSGVYIKFSTFNFLAIPNSNVTNFS